MTVFSAQKRSSQWLMQQVMIAMIPGIILLTVLFGFGSLMNIFWAILFALGSEALVMYWRKRPIKNTLADGSALITALVLAIALPPASAWWLLAIGCLFAILIVKQAYGGLGYNLFNPAMAGFALLLVSVPQAFIHWPTAGFIGAYDALLISLGLHSLPDSYTAATALHLVKQNNSLLMEQLWQAHPQLSWLADSASQWISLGFLAGGIYLLARGIFSWHAPIAMLLTLGLCAVFFYDNGSSASAGSPLLHWFAGGTVFAAFFVITEPVSSAASNKGKILYGALIGLLLFLLRHYSSYTDGIAFSVLLANCCVPIIDYFSRPLALSAKSKGHD